MKILHTADWHLGKKLDSFSRMEEQREVLQEICEIADNEAVDVVLIAGDLYDTFNPPAEAVDLFYKTLKKLTKEGKRLVVAIAGNHDSPERIEAPDPLARACGIVFAGYPHSLISTCELECGISINQSDEGFIEVTLPKFQFPLRIILTPYANEYRLKIAMGAADRDEEYRNILEKKWRELAKKYCDEKGFNLLISHLFLIKKGEELPEEPEEEKPILHVGGSQPVFSENIPPEIQYVALGHIHGMRTMDTSPCPIVYSGSPLAYSFSEANKPKFVVVFEASPGKTVEIKKIKLTKGKKLLRKTFENIFEAIDWLKDNKEALIELTIVTEKYLTAEDKKALYQTHEGIVAIIPEVKDKEFLEKLSCRAIDLSKSTEELFREYFEFRFESKPNERLLNLFKEVQAEEEET